MRPLRDMCQLRYKLDYGRLKCPRCHMGFEVYPGIDSVIDDFKCYNCGAHIRLPFHYCDVYHNKHCTVKEDI